MLTIVRLSINSTRNYTSFRFFFTLCLYTTIYIFRIDLELFSRPNLLHLLAVRRNIVVKTVSIMQLRSFFL
jgi:hypothetical protein